MGYGFHWFPYKTPYLTLLDGSRIDVEVDGGIPYPNMDASPYPGKVQVAPATIEAENPCSAVVTGDVPLSNGMVTMVTIVEAAKTFMQDMVSSVPRTGVNPHLDS